MQDRYLPLWSTGHTPMSMSPSEITDNGERICCYNVCWYWCLLIAFLFGWPSLRPAANISVKSRSTLELNCCIAWSQWLFLWSGRVGELVSVYKGYPVLSHVTCFSAYQVAAVVATAIIPVQPAPVRASVISMFTPATSGPSTSKAATKAPPPARRRRVEGTVSLKILNLLRI